jgi:hypothetical protein
LVRIRRWLIRLAVRVLAVLMPCSILLGIARVIHVKIVTATALMAFARKAIVFDYDQRGRRVGSWC